MEGEQIQIEELLRKVSLFQDLDPWQISSMVDRLDVLHLADRELLYNEGEEGDSLYIVYSGEIVLAEGRGTDERSFATMVMGDFFGEESVLHERPRTYTVRALGDATLLRINSDLFFDLIQESNTFRPTLEASEKSMELASRMTFRWLSGNEAVHIVTRKHIMLLWLSLIAPVLIGLTSAIFFFLAYVTETITPVMCGVAIVVVSIAYAIWQIIDWANDYYIVTDQRVVWMEKILGLYESRQEAPMRTLLAVELGTDQIGRIFGYGDVIVRTYTTQIVLEATAHPEAVASMIRQYWQLAQSRKLEQEEDEMVHAVREHLGLDEEDDDGPQPQEKPPAAAA
ncbi:MAG: cyclic nucleotide-binding domain-containing protein, partial [Anaerolineales bacterium]|nr:cyclic nucleotide-binding domain-containing protein [Anaerolineales bacterium]